MLFVSDLHLSPSTLPFALPMLRSIVEEAVQRKDPYICFPGDLLPHLYKLDIWVMNVFKDILEEAQASGITIILVPGNHDLYDLNSTINALSPFRSENVLVFDKPGTLSIGNSVFHFLPFLRHNQLAPLADLPRPALKRCYLVSHFGIQGAWMNNLMQDRDGVLLEDVEALGYDRVLLGHYHRPQTLGKDHNIHYIGTPYEVSAAEAGQPKGIGHLDTENNVYTFLQRSWGPKHSKVDIENSASLASLAKGDKVKLRAKKSEVEKAHALKKEHPELDISIETVLEFGESSAAVLAPREVLASIVEKEASATTVLERWDQIRSLSQ